MHYISAKVRLDSALTKSCPAAAFISFFHDFPRGLINAKAVMSPSFLDQ